jgi:hypothetical protein
MLHIVLQMMLFSLSYGKHVVRTGTVRRLLQ